MNGRHEPVLRALMCVSTNVELRLYANTVKLQIFGTVSVNLFKPLEFFKFIVQWYPLFGVYFWSSCVRQPFSHPSDSAWPGWIPGVGSITKGTIQVLHKAQALVAVGSPSYW